MKYKAQYSVKRTESDGHGYFRVIGKDRDGPWEMVTFKHITEEHTRRTHKKMNVLERSIQCSTLETKTNFFL